MSQRFVKLQDALLQSNRLFIADEVMKALVDELPRDFHGLFYMRQRRRFTDRGGTLDPYLRFQYLAFEARDGGLFRFNDQDHLKDREAHLFPQLTLTQASESHVMRWAPHAEVSPEDMANLTRCFLSFFHVCGAREHFVENVSRRFTREFVERHGPDPGGWTKQFKYIRHNLGLDVALGFGPESAKGQKVEKLADLIELVKGSSRSVGLLAVDPNFLRDLRASIARKSSNYGHHVPSGIYYAIDTLTEEVVIGGKGTPKEYKLARRAVVILMSRGDRPALDIFQSATKLVSNSLRERSTTFRETPFYEVLDSCQRLEERLGFAPQETRLSLDTVLQDLLVTFFQEATDQPTSLAEHIGLRRYDPSTRRLQWVAGTRHPSRETLSLDDVQFGPVRAFVEEAAVAIPHAREREETEAQGVSIPANALGDPDDAAFIVPLRVGGVISGVVEFTTTRDQNLRTDQAFFQRVAVTCGDVIRRIELANDRAWLSRMSYVHAARHRIEAIIRDIGDSQAAQADELRTLLSNYSTVQLTERESLQGDVDARTQRMIDTLPKRLLDDPEIHGFCKRLCAACEETAASDRAFSLILDVVETLGSNSGHSGFKPADVSLGLTGGPEGRALELTYRPQARQPIDKLARVCVSPIKDARSPTYHFGLFLLAAQIRMAGGVAQAIQPKDDGLGHSEFGVSFIIPLGTPEDMAS